MQFQRFSLFRRGKAGFNLRLLITLLLLTGLLITGCSDDDDDDEDGDGSEESTSSVSSQEVEDTQGNGESGGDEASSTTPPDEADSEVADMDSADSDSADHVFAVIGDFGDTLTLDEEPDTLLVADLIKSWDPARIFTVGDNDYSDAEFAGDPVPARYTGLEMGVGQFFHSYIGDYKGSAGAGAAGENRFFPIPGDHDYGDDCDDPRLEPYLEYFTLPVGAVDETYYEFREGSVHFFAIDSVRDCHQDDGAKLNAQMNWLQTSSAASDAPFKVVLVHHPPFSSGANHGSAEYMRWDYAGWDVDLVIAGDDHIYERIERDGVTYLVNGVGGVELHSFASSPVEGSVKRYDSEFGAVRMDAFPTRLVVSFVTIDGATQDQFTLQDS